MALADDVRLIEGWEPAQAIAHVIHERRGAGVALGGVGMETARPAFTEEELADWRRRHAEPWWAEAERVARLARIRVETFAGTSTERAEAGFANVWPALRIVSSRSTLARTAAAYRLGRSVG